MTGADRLQHFYSRADDITIGDDLDVLTFVVNWACGRRADQLMTLLTPVYVLLEEGNIRC